MQPITGIVQHYPWGDPQFIPEFLGVAPDGRPWAELWLGTHSNGPSVLGSQPGGQPLSTVTGPLPYLLKVLAAATPLSLQTHPNAEQAKAGYQVRRYSDPYPKPELLCALTRFEAFCGVRPLDETAAFLDELRTSDARQLADVLGREGVAGAIEALLRRTLPCVGIIDACAGSERPEAIWATRLADRYYGDPSVVVTLLLNYVRLDPGEALQLGPGNLHAYLGGAGIELMGASDNVVRAGLTTKRIDIDTLLDVMDDTPLMDPVLSESRVYPLTDCSIRLLRLVGPSERHAKVYELVVTDTGNTGYLEPGERWTVPAGVTAYIATN